MFSVGDIVRIKEEWRNPGETDCLYRIDNVNEITKRCYIELLDCNLPLAPQELVSFEMIEKI